MPLNPQESLEFYRKFTDLPASITCFDGEFRAQPRLPNLAIPAGTVPAKTLPELGKCARRDDMKLFDLVMNPREIRRRLGMNQEEFWTRVGVSQSGGSRYESGRSMPKPVKELLRLVHIERVDLSKVRKEDFDVIEHLKNSQPDS